MKKLLLAFMAILAISSTTFAQSINVGSLKESIAKSDKDLANPKKAVKASTWLKRAKIYLEAAYAPTKSVSTGLTESLTVSALGKFKKAENKKVDKTTYRVLYYNYVTIYLKSGKEGTVQMWEEIKPAIPNAFDKAMEAFDKAIELDPKAESKAKDAYKEILKYYVSESRTAFMIANYKKASIMFSKSHDIAVNPLVGDTASAHQYLNLAGDAAIKSKDFKKAITIFKKLLEAKYYKEGETHRYIGYAYDKLGNTKEAEAMYVAGVDMFPTNQDLMNNLIDLYTRIGEDPIKVIPYIKRAQKASPKDAKLVFIEGAAYQGMKDYEKAHAAYDIAKTLDPKFFNVFYNDGLAYYNEAVSIVADMDKLDVTNRKAYDAMYDKAVGVFVKSTESLEQAHSIDKKNKDSVELLKNIYFRLRDVKPEYMENYTKYNNLLKTM